MLLYTRVYLRVKVAVMDALVQVGDSQEITQRLSGGGTGYGRGKPRVVGGNEC